MSTYMLYLHINQSNLCDMIKKVYGDDFYCVPFCKKLSKCDDAFFAQIRQVREYVRFKDIEPYIRIVNNKLELLFYFDTPLCLSDDEECVILYDSMCVRLSKMVNNLNNELYSYAISLIGRDIVNTSYKCYSKRKYLLSVLSKDLDNYVELLKPYKKC